MFNNILNNYTYEQFLERFAIEFNNRHIAILDYWDVNETYYDGEMVIYKIHSREETFKSLQPNNKGNEPTNELFWAKYPFNQIYVTNQNVIDIINSYKQQSSKIDQCFFSAFKNEYDIKNIIGLYIAADVYDIYQLRNKNSNDFAKIINQQRLEDSEVRYTIPKEMKNVGLLAELNNNPFRYQIFRYLLKYKHPGIVVAHNSESDYWDSDIQ